MPTAFHPWSLHRIPDRSTFGRDTQLHLGISHSEAPEAAHTEVHLADAAFMDRVARYTCVHEFLGRLKYPSRTQGRIFQDYVTPYHFDMYTVAEPGEARPTVWVKTKDAVAKDFIGRLCQLPDFHAVERQVNFDAVRERQPIIEGAWFHEMRAANLSATGVFGSRVDQSQEFMRAEQQGRLRTLYFPYRAANGESSLLMLTQEGCVVTYNSFESAEAELGLVLDFKRTILDHCWSM